MCAAGHWQHTLWSAQACQHTRDSPLNSGVAHTNTSATGRSSPCTGALRALHCEAAHNELARGISVPNPPPHPLGVGASLASKGLLGKELRLTQLPGGPRHRGRAPGVSPGTNGWPCTHAARPPDVRPTTPRPTPLHSTRRVPRGPSEQRRHQDATCSLSSLAMLAFSFLRESGIIFPMQHPATHDMNPPTLRS